MVTYNILLIAVTLLGKEMKGKNSNICTNTFLTNMTETTMPTVIILSAADPVAVAGIYEYRSLLSILYFLQPQQFVALFLGELSIPSFLNGLCPLSACSSSCIKMFCFPLDLITGHGSTKIPNNLLNSRHNLIYFHCREAIQFPGSITPPIIAIPFLACWFMGIRRPKWAGGRLRFQFDGMFIVTPGRCTPLWVQNF